MDHSGFKYLPRRAASDKILSDKALNIAKNPKYDGCQRGLASMVYKYFWGVLLKVKLCQANNSQMNCTSQQLKNSKGARYTHCLALSGPGEDESSHPHIKNIITFERLMALTRNFMTIPKI